MNMKIKCSVIQDLLPSYVDEICSDDTKELIEEHTAECKQCREKLEQMKNTGIIAGKAAGKQIDYLKKIHSTILHKEWLGKFILMLLVGITFAGLFVGYGGLINYGQISSVVFSILIFCAAGLAGNCRFSGKRKTAAVEIFISGTVFIFILAVNEYFVQNLLQGKVPFPFHGMEMHNVGPFYVNILRIAALTVIIVLIWNTFGKHKNAYATILNVTALSLIAYVNDWLYHMDVPDACLRTAHELAISQIILTVIGITAFVFMQKFNKVPSGMDDL